MKVLCKAEDGGPDSSVTGYFLIESKRFFSIVLLKFEGKSRQAYHSPAFDAISWLFKGKLIETFYQGPTKIHEGFLTPIVTWREDFHKVDSEGTSWVLSIRGPWQEEWDEYLPLEDRHQVLTPGRVVKNRT